MKDLENRIVEIEDRNRRVELDKAWETSFIRRGLIAGLTFVLVGVYLVWLGVSKPWLNALVPTAGFLLSSMVIQRAKTTWLRKHIKD